MRMVIPVTVEMTDKSAAEWLQLMEPEDLEHSLVRCVLRGARQYIPLYYALVDAKGGDVRRQEGYTWAWELPDDVLHLIGNLMAELESENGVLGSRLGELQAVIKAEKDRRER